MKKITLLLTFIIFILFNYSSFSQTLVAGDIAFIGMNEDTYASSQDHSFSWIALKDIPAGEVIYFTEQGVNINLNTWFGNTEGHYAWTSPAAGTPLGTVVYVYENTSNSLLVPSIGTMTTNLAGSGWSLSGGDQVLAYQATSVKPGSILDAIFISGIHKEGDASGETNSWTYTTYNGTGTAYSHLPPGLSNGVNCISVFDSGTEYDNVRYSGTLTGTSTVLRGLINNKANWTHDLTNATAIDIRASSYSSDVTSDVPKVTTTPASLIAATSAALAGNVTVDGGATVTERGIVYSTSDTTPTIAEGATKDTNGTGTGTFSETVSSLTASTTYYYNSYATNSVGTSYGTAQTFTTTAPATILTEGDIAFTRINMDDESFSFVFLVPIANTTQFVITDETWNSSNIQGSSESKIRFTATSSFAAGEEISISATALSFASSGSGTATLTSIGAFSPALGNMLGSAGDNLFIFQPEGTPGVNDFVAGINANSGVIGSPDNAWQIVSTTSTSSSGLPSGLINGTNALGIFPNGGAQAEVDNARYKSTALRSGDKATVLAAIMTLSNWEYHNSTVQAPVGSSFTITGGNAALPSATKTDALLVDNDFNGQLNAGETVRYTVVVSNPDVDATLVMYNITPDANSTLVLGSVTTNQGTVISGNSPGNTGVSISLGTVSAGGSVTITYDVLINNPFVGGSQISAQGTITGSNFSDVLTDDPGIVGVADATVSIVSDNTAPVFENSTPSAASIAGTSFTLNTDINEGGIIYYVIVANGASAPTSAEVKAGTASGGGAALNSANATVSSGGFTNAFSVTGLTASTAYDVYVVAEDDAGSHNLQTSPTKVDVTTQTPPPVLITSIVRQTPTDASTGADQVVFRVTFAKAVINVDASDFTLSGTSAGDGTVGTVVPVSTSIYDVTVTGVTNSNGTINLDIKGNDGVSGSNNITEPAGSVISQTTTSGVITRAEFGQSFVASSSGSFTKVELYVNAAATYSGSATMELRTGDGLSGSVLATEAITIVDEGSAYQQTFTFTTPASVTSGNTYTIRFTGSGAFGTTYTVDAATGDPLSEGVLYQPTALVGADLTFQATISSEGGVLSTTAPVTDETYTISNLITPTITFADINKTYGDADFNVAATSNSAGAISYAVVAGGTGTATLSGTNNETVTPGTAGTVTIRATQVADALFTAQTKDITLTIAQKEITMLGITVSNKTYDGTTSGTTGGTDTLTGVLSGDAVSIGASGPILSTFATANIGTGITVNTTGFAIGGTHAGNYTLTQPTSLANITAKGLTITGLTGDDKMYDGTTVATASGTPDLSGIEGTDAVTLGGTPAYAFASANPGTAITITTTGYTISGGASGNYTLTQPTLAATITGPSIAFTSTSSNGLESVTSANLSVDLSIASTQTVTVDYAVSGGTATGSGTDYTLASGTLTFDPGDTSKNITASIVNEAMLEANETFIVTISNSTNGSLGTNTSHTYTITNDDTATVTIADISGNENDGAITVTATLDNQVIGGFTVDVSTANGTAAVSDSDYGAVTSQTLTFAGTAGETQTFTISPTGDTKLEANETITISQSNLAATSLGVVITDSATVTITNDDTASVTIADVSGNEDNGSVSVTLTLDNAVQGGFTVDLSTLDGTAIKAIDYLQIASQPKTFTGTAGETQTVNIILGGNTVVEADETLSVSMDNLTATTLPVTITDGATITILNDDSASLAIDNVTKAEGADGTTTAFTFTVTLTGTVDAAFSVDYATANISAIAGSDYVAATGTLNFAGTNGETQQFTVTVNGDEIVELDQTFSVELSNLQASGKPITIPTAGTGTIQNDDIATVIIADVSANEDEGAQTITATLDKAVDGGFVVDVFTTDGTATSNNSREFTSTRGTVILPKLTFSGTAGETQTLQLGGVSDNIVELDETFTIGMKSLDGTTLSTTNIDITSVATFTILNDDSASITIEDVSANEDDGAITVTARLDNTVQDGLTVDVSTLDGTATIADSDYGAITNQTLTFAGSSGETQTFTITPTSDSNSETNETLSIVLSNLSPSLAIDITDGATVTLLDDDAPTVTTTDASLVAQLSATLAGNVTNAGGSTVTDRGIIYSLTATNANPEISGVGVVKDSNGTGIGAFSKAITGLSSSAGYSFRSYAINSSGTAYGTVKTFTTLALISPTITFANVNKIFGDANFDLAATSNSSGALSYSIVGAANGSSLSGTNNATVTLGNSGTVTIRVTQAANGIYIANTKDITLTIGKRPLTVTADADQNKTTGETDPTLTYSITSGGLVNGDTFTGALSREVGELAGPYAIQIGTLSAGANYDLTFISNDFVISIVLTTGYILSLIHI